MPDHIRKQVRDYAESEVSSITDFEGRIYKNHTYPVEQLPGLIIYNGNEEMEPINLGRVLQRTFELVFEIYATSDDQLDDLCKQIEEVMSSDRTAAGITKDIYPVSTEFQFSDGADPSGSATITYSVLYWTSINNPDIAR